MRIFISIELPDKIKEKIAGAISSLKESGANVKWVEPKNLHVTLKFLGWVEDQKIDKVIELTGRAAGETESFPAKFKGLETFAGRVVWVGVSKGGNELKRIADSLEETLSGAGYRSEKREFTSHLTIGRIKDRKGVEKLKEKMEKIKDTEFGEMTVDRIAIIKSTLTPKGPIYELIKEVNL